MVHATMNPWRYIPTPNEGSEEETDLLNLMLESEWDQVLERLSCLWKGIEDFPQELVLDDPDLMTTVETELGRLDEEGNTVLHVAVDNYAPLSVIRALLLKNPFQSFEKLTPAGGSLEEEGRVSLASIANAHGDTALHRAAFVSNNATLFELLAMAYPEAGTMKNEDSKSPVFYAGSPDAPMNAVTNLLGDESETEGETSEEEDSDEEGEESTPGMEIPRGKQLKALLDALPEIESTKDDSRPMKLLTCLFKYCPESVRLRDCYNCTILHFAVMDAVDTETLRLICELYPDSCQIQNRFGCTALQSAARVKSPLEVMKLLVNTFPGAISMPNNLKYLPFTRSIQVRAEMECLEFLLGLDPRASVFLNKKGFNGFDMLDMTHKAREVVLPYIEDPTSSREELNEAIIDWWSRADLMLKLYAEDSVQGKITADYYKPLHITLSIRSTRTLVDYCLWQFPEDVFVVDHMGRLPLHVAAATAAQHGDGINPEEDSGEEGIAEPENIILALLKLYPEASNTKDAEGRFPLHCMLESPNVNTKALSGLLAANPEALEARVGGLFPFQMAAAQKVEDDLQQMQIIFELLRAAPSLVLPE